MKKIFSIYLLMLIMWAASDAIAQTPPMCTVFDTLRNQNGVALSGARVTVSNVIKSGGELFSLGSKSYLSNSAGIVSFALPRNAQANIEAYFGQFNMPGGRQVLIPNSASVLLRQLQPGSISVSTNAGPVTIREIDGSPSYPITGNNDTLEVSAGTLSNPSANVFRLSTSTSFLEFLGDGLDGATDTTAYDIPSKLFSVGDSAEFDFSVTERFESIDSIEVYTTTTSTAGDSMALSAELKKIAPGGSVSAAYNAAMVDTVDMGSGATLIVFHFTSFGTLATGVGEIVGKIRRKSLAANEMAAKGIVRRLKIYGVGLR